MDVDMDETSPHLDTNNNFNNSNNTNITHETANRNRGDINSNYYDTTAKCQHSVKIEQHNSPVNSPTYFRGRNIDSPMIKRDPTSLFQDEQPGNTEANNHLSNNATSDDNNTAANDNRTSKNQRQDKFTALANMFPAKKQSSNNNCDKYEGLVQISGPAGSGKSNICMDVAADFFVEEIYEKLKNTMVVENHKRQKARNLRNSTNVKKEEQNEDTDVEITNLS